MIFINIEILKIVQFLIFLVFIGLYFLIFWNRTSAKLINLINKLTEILQKTYQIKKEVTKNFQKNTEEVVSISTLSNKEMNALYHENNENYLKGISLSGIELIEYVTATSTDRVNNIIRSREEMRFRLWTIIISIIGILGTGTLFWILKELVQEEVNTQWSKAQQILQEKLNSQIKQSLENEIGELKHRLTQEVAYQQLSYLALSLKIRKEGFTKDERDAIMLLIKQISKDKEIIGRSQFSIIMEKIIESFDSADLVENINEIDNVLQEILVKYDGCAITLVNHFGQLLVGDPFPERYISKFSVYADSVREFGYSEVVLFWQLLFHFKNEGLKRQTKVDELIRIFLNLEKNKQILLSKLLRTFSNINNFQSKSNPKGKEIERVVTILIKEYPELIQEQFK